jgi:hypothetical protein
MHTHELKTAPVFFAAVARGDKTAEVRNNDRAFRLGDELILREWRSQGGYSGESVRRVITHILRHEDHPGIAPGYVILSLAPKEEPANAE